MKRLVLFILGVAACAATQAQVSAPSLTASAGTTAIVDIRFTAAGGLFTAVQFDLEIDTMLNPTAVIGTAAVTAGKSLTAADLGSGKRRFLIAGLNQTTIQ